MGGEAPIDAVAARSVLAWWLQAGVDVAIQEDARNWLASALAKPAAKALEPAPQDAMPNTLEAFRAWLVESRSLPGSELSARRVLPVGTEGAPMMLMSDAPSAEDAASGQPIGGDAWILAQRMLAAIGIAADDAYVASLACFHAPGGQLSAQDLPAWAQIARRHVALAKPERLLLLGDGACRALLGKPVAQARGHVYKVEGVRTAATFHPRMLIKAPTRKADAWRDLLLLMEDDS